MMPASRRQDLLFGLAPLIHHRGSAAVIVGMTVSDRFSDRQMTGFPIGVYPRLPLHESHQSPRIAVASRVIKAIYGRSGERQEPEKATPVAAPLSLPRCLPSVLSVSTADADPRAHSAQPKR